MCCLSRHMAVGYRVDRNVNFILSFRMCKRFILSTIRKYPGYFDTQTAFNYFPLLREVPTVISDLSLDLLSLCYRAS